jgi:hypothetical protein
MKNYQRALMAVILTGLMIACAPTTQLRKTWSDPSLTKETVKSFNKILVIASFKDDVAKRTAEDKIAAQIKNAVAVQSYNYLKPTDKDQKLVEEKLKKDGFDGIILMRLKNVEKRSAYVPGTAYAGWYGYSYSPGYVYTDVNFIVETNIYSLDSRKLLWTATTSSLNPTTLNQTLDDIIQTVKWQLEKKGLLKK